MIIFSAKKQKEQKEHCLIKNYKKMTKEQLAKGRDLQDAILAAKEIIKSLTITKENPYKIEAYFYNIVEKANVKITVVESEIVEKIKQVLIDCYTEKAARLEKEFTNL